MIKKWAVGLCIGFFLCGGITGLLFGDIGNYHEAYYGEFIHVVLGALVCFIPFIIGIHTGILHERNI